MSDKSKKLRPKKRPPEGSNYDVGFAKPPVQGQFKPGVSGNRRGRPKKGEIPDQLILPPDLDSFIGAKFKEHGAKVITVQGADGSRRMTKHEVIMENVVNSAAKGNAKAQKLYFEYIDKNDHERNRLHYAMVDELIAYKEACERERQRYEKAGMKPPEFLPNPDHILIHTSGAVEILGPVTKYEKQQRDRKAAEAKKWFCEYRKRTTDEIALLEGELKKKISKKLRLDIEEDLVRHRATLARIAEIIPEDDAAAPK